MCVILVIEPGVTVPDDKIETACDVNKHGHGVAYVHKGLLRVRRSINPNDPEVIQKTLHSLRAYKTFLHLRHATVGEVSMENNHPMVVWEQNKKTIMMMHNGTLNEYSPPKDDTRSDTYWFAQKWVRPLVQRIAAAVPPKDVLTDPIFQRAMTKELGLMSVVVLFDAWGNSFIVNKQKGKDFDGWWSSNDYSFDTHHTRATTATGFEHLGSPYGAYCPDDPPARTTRRATTLTRPALPFTAIALPDIEEVDLLAAWTKREEETTERLLAPWESAGKAWPYHPAGQPALQAEVTALVSKIKETQMTEKSMVHGRQLTVERLGFLAQAGLENYDQLGHMSFEDWEGLAVAYPAAVAQLIIDLYHEAGLAKTKAKESNDG